MSIGNGFTLSDDNTNIIKCSVSFAFSVHPDYKSYSGMTMTMVKGAVISISNNLNFDTKIITEAYLIASDNVMMMILLVYLFLNALGF